MRPRKKWEPDHRFGGNPPRCMAAASGNQERLWPHQAQEPQEEVSMSNITDKLAEALRVAHATLERHVHGDEPLQDMSVFAETLVRVDTALAEYEQRPMTMFDMAKALHERGLYIGPRDPQRNTDFDGVFMVCEDVNVPAPTRDASRGGFCIVGDDLHDLIRNAYRHTFD